MGAITTTLFCWSSAYVGIRYGLHDFHPGSLALLRFITASLCMLLIHKFILKKPENALVKSDVIKVMGLGMIGMGLYNIFLGLGETTVSSSVAGFNASEIPIFSALFAVWFLKEKINKWGILGFMTSLLGVSLIVFDHDKDVIINIGALYVLFSAICAAVLFVFQKPILKRMEPLRVAVYAVWGATLVLMVFLPQLIHDIKVATLKESLIIIYLGIFPTCLAYATWNYALSKATATKVTSTMYAVPVITCLLGWLFLGEIITVKSLLGGMLALFGAVLLAKGFNQQTSKGTAQ